MNWLDPLGYPKPHALSLALPSESACTNKYFVDLSNGSGTACTSASPCAIAAVQGKPGTHGDGKAACIYLKGSGAVGSPVLYGSAGNEVVIRPWPGTTATITGRNNWTTRIQYVAFDGGPSLAIRFVNTANSEFDPSIYFNAASAGLESHITFYRTQWTVPDMGEYISQWGIVDNLSIVNSEFQSEASTDTGNQHHIYFSGASNYGASAHIYLRNNIFRSTPGEEIEFRMFQNMDDVVIDGNAFHDIGKGTCPGGWKCRPAITVASSGASVTHLRISNNLFWDLGEGAVRMWDGSPLVYNNTVWQWGQGRPANGGYGQWAFYGYSNDGGGTIINNIIYGTGKTANGYPLIPFDGSPFTKSNNLCAAGTSCGSSSRSWSANTLISLDPSSPSFMTIGSGSEAIDAGATLPEVNLDYGGAPRPRGAGHDIGAFEF